MQDEIGRYLAAQAQAFDLIAAADTFIYFGDLLPLFGQVREALRPGGLFVFTIEALRETEGQGYGWQLTASGRYRHSEAFVRTALEANGLQCVYQDEGALRTELLVTATGLVFVARLARG